MRGLIAFKEDPFIQALKGFFEDLQVPVNYIADEPASAADILGDKYKANDPAHKLIDDVYVLGMVDDAIFEGQNQLFKEEWSTARLQKIDKDYDGLVVFGVTLKQRENDLLPTRSQLAGITRAFNRTFAYTPVTVVFKYGNHIAFANSERAKYKQEWREGERVGKVTMLKDVSIEKTHSGHIRILRDMQINRSGKDAVTSFSGLYNYWQSVFNVSTLNKSFYDALFNWYLWASKHVKFPQIRPQDDLIDDKVHQSESLIRLLTRLLFCWFMKEKGLIKDEIFNHSYIKTILKDFQGAHSDETIYYKTILQNLFFATLSKPIASRKLIGKEFPNPHYGDQLVYRYVESFNKDVNILELFSNIPFLNGGLFDCLDQRKDKDNPVEIRLDGFSNTKSKQPVVPDKLFFGEYKNIDLSGEYDDKKKSNQTVHGLIDILYGYKFTIEENTPVEEEIALDPELLGRVFENLLASYNPETKTTARKQTGSFFTPRPIVDYMVDESLVAYLEQQMKDHIPGLKEMDSLSEMLREVLSYTEKEHPFNDKEIDVLIQAFDNVKILDPACGSGAFPMGMLQKMLHLLRKIDPENKKWFEKVIAKFPAYLQNEMRNKLQHENWDYVRKLGIIQECIYGIDIQPIAIQIAKLRFFISLLVDQKEKPGMDNRGFEPLPNLDFKLVAANTLIAPPETDAHGDGLFADIKDDFTLQFEKLTEQYFTASAPEDKKTIKEQIAMLITQKCNGKIKQIESRTAHADERASKVLKEKHKEFIKEKEREIKLWNSYKNIFKQESVGFFDAKYFFPRVTDGFDIVIGNPPYGFHQIHEKTVKKYFKARYAAAQGSFVHYFLFLEASLQLLRLNGSLAFIVPVTWLTIPSAKSLRKFILTNYSISEICWMSEAAFENASVNTLITLIRKNNSGNTNVKIFDKFTTFPQTPDIQKNVPQNKFVDDGHIISIFSSDEEDNILNKIRDVSKTLDFFASPCSGYNPYEVGAGIALDGGLHTEQTVKDKPYHSDKKLDDQWKPEVVGRDLSRYHVGVTGLRWVKYGPWLAAARDPENFKGKRVLVQEITGGREKRIVAAYYDGGELYHSRDIISIKLPNQKPDPFFLLAIINSQFICWYHHKRSPKAQKGLFPKILVSDLKQLPIPNVPPVKQAPIVALVEQILAAKKADKAAEVTALETEIDLLVYALYGLTEDEIAVVEGKSS